MSCATAPVSRLGGSRRVFTTLGVFAALLLGGATAVACDPGPVPSAPAASLTTAPTSGVSAPATTTAAPVTTVPTVAPVPVAPAPVAPPETTAQAAPVNPPAPGGSCGDGDYVNSDGACVQRPVAAPTAPAGATARCNDGTYSFSKHHSGTCSGHGGVAEWL